MILYHIDKKWTYINVFWSLATITHCSESLPFVQKFKFDKTLILHLFEFLRQNWPL